MHPNHHSDIEQKLEAFTRIQPEESLSQKCDELFDKQMLKHQKTFARRSSNRRNPLKAAASWLVFSIAWTNRTHYRKATALSFAVMFIIVCALIWTPQRGVLAATLEALQAVQTMQFKLIQYVDGKITSSETIFWQSPNQLRMEQYNADQILENLYWMNEDHILMIDHKKQRVLQGDNTPANMFHIYNENRWLSRENTPLQVLTHHMDFISQNWETVSVREDQVETNPITKYMFGYKDGRTSELTVDSATELPLNVRFIYPANEKHGNIETVYQFDWNIALADEHFRPEIPEQYLHLKLNEFTKQEISNIKIPGNYETWQVRYDMNPTSASTAGQAVVTGNVIDTSGKPVANALVGLYQQHDLIYKDNFLPLAYTDASGYFRIQFPMQKENAAKENIFAIQCQANGYKSSSIFVQLDQFSPTSRTKFILNPGTSVSGKVVDENNNPLVGVKVSTLHFYDSTTPGIDTRIYAETNQQGIFTLNGLGYNHDKYPVLIQKEGYVPVQSIAFRKGMINQHFEFDTNEFVLQKGASRWIQVVDQNGQPIEGAEIFAYPFYTDGSAYTDVDGKIELFGFTNTEIPFTVRKKGFGFDLFTVTFDQHDPLVITLQPGIRIQGKVIDQYGNPVSGIQVHTGLNHGMDRALSHGIDRVLLNPPTNDDGMFVVDGIKPNTKIFFWLKSPVLNYFTGLPIENAEDYQDQIVELKVNRLLPVEGSVVYEETGEPVSQFAVFFNRQQLNQNNGTANKEDENPVVVYHSTSGYFRKLFSAISDYGIKEEKITVNVYTGDDIFNPENPSYSKTLTMDEMKVGNLKIEIPKP